MILFLPILWIICEPVFGFGVTKTLLASFKRSLLARQSPINIRHSLRQTQHVVNDRVADIAV